MNQPMFDWSIIGHQCIQNYLQKSIIYGRIFHAYLFIGSEFLGKNTLAEKFCQSILCYSASNKSGKSGNIPCLQCTTCQQFQRGLYPDYFRLERAAGNKNITVASVRLLQNQLSKKTFANNFKCVVITDVHFMNISAMNALLKILEEPPTHTVFILIAPNMRSVPATIASRCHSLFFETVSDCDLLHYAEQHADERAYAVEFVSESGGKPGKLIDFMQHPKKHETVRLLAQNFVKILETPSLADQLLLLDSVLPKKKNADAAASILEILHVWVDVLRDTMLIKQGKKEHIRYKIYGKNLLSIANLYDIQYILSFLQRILQSESKIISHHNPKMVIENTLIHS